MSHDVIRNISSQHCKHCGGEVGDWKCWRCGWTNPVFTPLHRKNCKFDDGKLKVVCKACQEAEDHCSCPAT